MSVVWLGGGAVELDPGEDGVGAETSRPSSASEVALGGDIRGLSPDGGGPDEDRRRLLGVRGSRSKRSPPRDRHGPCGPPGPLASAQMPPWHCRRLRRIRRRARLGARRVVGPNEMSKSFSRLLPSAGSALAWQHSRITSVRRQRRLILAGHLDAGDLAPPLMPRDFLVHLRGVSHRGRLSIPVRRTGLPSSMF